MWQKLGIGAAAGSLFAACAYTTNFFFAKKQSFNVSNTHRRDTFNSIAQEYDDKTSFHEYLIGISNCREELLSNHCTGDILEVGAGTGKSIGLFDHLQITSVTLSDRSPNMLKVMRAKFAKFKNDTLIDVPHSFHEANAEMLPFETKQFDTVIDMFGLCSYDDPLQALREMSRVCKPGGKIILLEHGKGTSRWLNDYLDKKAPSHADAWGCWWNRDIHRIVRLSGLKCQTERLLHFGSTQARICSP